MIEFKGNIFRMGLRACRKKKYSFDLEEKLKSSSIRISKDVIYLNDFYDLLYEKGEKEIIENQNPPKYFKSEKFYTMRPGIDFPLIMNYTDTGYEEPYFYFLNGHGDVTYFADSNFTLDQIESYEYNIWGLVLTEFQKNNILYSSLEFDKDINSYNTNKNIFNSSLGLYSSIRNKKIMFLNVNAFKQFLKIKLPQLHYTIEAFMQQVVHENCFKVPSDRSGCDKYVCFHCYLILRKWEGCDIYTVYVCLT